MDKPVVLNLRGRPYGVHTPLVRRFLLRCMLIEQSQWVNVGLPNPEILHERSMADSSAEDMAISSGRLAEFKSAQQAAWAIVEKDSTRANAQIASELAGAMTVLDLLKVEDIEAAGKIWFEEVEPGSVDEIKIELLNARMHARQNEMDSHIGLKSSIVDAWHRVSDSVYGDPSLGLYDFLGKIERLSAYDLELLAKTKLAHTQKAKEEVYIQAISSHLPVEDLLGAAWAAFWSCVDGSILTNKELHTVWVAIENVTLALLCEAILEPSVFLLLKAPWEMVAGEIN